MLDKTHRAESGDVAGRVVLPEPIIAELARLAVVPASHVAGFSADIRSLFANSTFIEHQEAIAGAVGRELGSARRDILRLHRRLVKYRNLAIQTDRPSKQGDVLASLAGRGFLGARADNIVSELSSLAEHIKKEIERVTGHPHKKGRRPGAAGKPALSDLIGELEFTALLHWGAGYGLGHVRSTGSLITALDLLRDCLPAGFIPKGHPISSYQAALDQARDLYAWDNTLESCFDRVIW